MLNRLLHTTRLQQRHAQIVVRLSKTRLDLHRSLEMCDRLVELTKERQ